MDLGVRGGDTPALERHARGDEIAHRDGCATEEQRDADVFGFLRDGRCGFGPAIRFVCFACVERALRCAHPKRELRVAPIRINGAHPRADDFTTNETVFCGFERATVRRVRELALATAKVKVRSARVRPGILREAMLESARDACARLGRCVRARRRFERLARGREREEPAVTPNETGNFERAERTRGAAEQRKIVLVPPATTQREREKERTCFERNFRDDVGRCDVLRRGPPRLEPDEVVVVERGERVCRERRDPAALVGFVE